MPWTRVTRAKEAEPAGGKVEAPGRPWTRVVRVKEAPTAAAHPGALCKPFLGPYVSHKLLRARHAQDHKPHTAVWRKGRRGSPLTSPALCDPGRNRKELLNNKGGDPASHSRHVRRDVKNPPIGAQPGFLFTWTAPARP